MLNKKSLILKLLTSLQKDHTHKKKSNREKQNKTTANKKQTNRKRNDRCVKNKQRKKKKKEHTEWLRMINNFALHVKYPSKQANKVISN